MAEPYSEIDKSLISIADDPHLNYEYIPDNFVRKQVASTLERIH